MRTICLLLLLLALPAQAVTASPLSAPAMPWDVAGVDVAAVIDGMTTEQRVGQLLLLGFGGAGYALRRQKRAERLCRA